MRRERLMMIAGLGAASVSAIMVLVSCLSDPREGEEVKIVDHCDTALLSTSPSSPESTLAAYVTASTSLLNQATAAEAALRDACNLINKDLGLPPGASNDSSSACNAIAARLAAILKTEPPSPPGAFSVTHFAEIFFPKTCTPTPGALETCLSACAGPCDPSKCEPGKLAGTCTNGDCLGTCSIVGDNIPCKGTCSGETLGLDNATCRGECIGRCGSPIWTGACSASCPLGFNGLCTGTCTGTCTVGSDTFMAGDAGVVDGGEGGAPPPSATTRPPGGDDGNCKGKCIGRCSKGANGFCASACLTFGDEPGETVGSFVSGFCGNAGSGSACTGKCRSIENGSVGMCNGTCTQLGKPQCEGICRTSAGGDGGAGGGCTGTLTNAFCEGNVACGQNAECNNACHATAKLAEVCTEPAVGSFILVTDPALYAALVKNVGPLGKAVNQVAQVREAFGFIGKTQLGDFKTLGLSGDLTRKCVEQGRANVAASDVLITKAGAANPVVYRKVQ